MSSRTDKIRIFVAIKIHPEKLLDDIISDFQRELESEKIKWVDSSNLHLTMRFIGESTRNQVEKLKSNLKVVENTISSFRFDIFGAGFFKNKGNPRVLFLKIKNKEKLELLNEVIEEAVQDAGFEKEERGFKPHLTIARIKFLEDKQTFYSLIEKYSEQDIQSVEVSEFILYQSILNQRGPKYIPLQKVKLNDIKDLQLELQG